MVEGILAEGAVLEFIQLQLLEKGGLIMLLIGVLSIIAAVIVIERLLYFRGRGADEDKLLKGLSNTLEEGLLDQAKGVCDQFHTPLASLISTGITRIRERKVSEKELRDHLLETASLEIPKEERFLSALGTIAHIAPLLGLLGTVTGNIRAFGVLGDLGAITDPALLSRGISEALLTTAAGIIVSIPAIIFYNFLVNKVNHRIIRLEYRVTELASLLVAADRTAASLPRPSHNGNGAIQPARTESAPASPGPGQPGMVPIVAASLPPAQPDYAQAQPVRAPHQVGVPPQAQPVFAHAATPGNHHHHQAAPAYASQAASPTGQFDAVPPAPAPAAPAAPRQFGAVPPRAAPAPAPAQAVPTRVVAVPTQIEAVPAT